jgi:hypothetical protein
LIPGLSQELYKMSLEYLMVPDSKGSRVLEVLKVDRANLKELPMAKTGAIEATK